MAAPIEMSSVNRNKFGILKNKIIGTIPFNVAIKLFMNNICRKGSRSERTFINKISTPMINAPAR